MEWGGQQGAKDEHTYQATRALRDAASCTCSFSDSYVDRVRWAEASTGGAQPTLPRTVPPYDALLCSRE